MDSITIDVSGLSGQVTLTVPAGSSIADVREAGQINPGLAIRANGSTVPSESEADTPVVDGQTLVTAPPAAKHG